MGVDIDIITGIGFYVEKTLTNEDFDTLDAIASEITDPEVTLIVDGMSGEYYFIGVVLSSFDGSMPDEDVTSRTLGQLAIRADKVMYEVDELYLNGTETSRRLIPRDASCRLVTFAHYS